jgi:Asp-tRNA(Asn)/Glu-tRNA(Gln) amidotransferase A subunit family amidase
MCKSVWPEPESSRREFLLNSGVFAAGALMSAGSAHSSQQQRPASQPQPAEDDDDAPETQGEPVEVEVIAAAEQLAGIAFTASEREMMSRTVAEQVSMLASRQTLTRFSNTLAPALKFDPRLPGMKIDIPTKASIWTREEMSRLPGDDADIAFAPVTSLSRWIESGALTSMRLTRIYLDRLKRFDPQLRCVITLCEEHALQQAAAADREIAAGNYRGPLHGIPWGAKDLLDTAGIRTTWGAEPWQDRVPDENATVVRRLDEAGAVLIAKLSLGALAYNDIWFGGRTSNPWNTAQGSSGSSAGSACATAAGLVGFSIGTETFGSITSPSIRCGATGLRPTFGRVSRAGAMALCWSLDKIGPICRTVEDCARVLDAINGVDDADPSSVGLPLYFDMQRDLADVRVGFSPRWFEQGDDLDRAAFDALKRTGVQMHEIDLPDWPYDILLTMLYAEAAAAFEDLTRSNLDDTLRWQAPQAWPNTFRQSWFLPAIEFVQANRFRRQCMQMMAKRFERVDVMIGPSFAGSLCLITNHTGHPSLTLRSGFRSPQQRRRATDAATTTRPAQRVPHGISLIGRLFAEGTLCRVGLALERELDVWRERPPLG